jgi:hypothetical protein
MRTHALRTATGALLIPLTALALVVGQAAMRAGAADHLDAPTVKSDHRIDINDVYVFEGANPGNTVLALTTNVAAGVLSGTTFRPGAIYEFKIDSADPDAVEDLTYRFKFGDVRGDGTQPITVHRADGAASPVQGGGGKLAGKGRTGDQIPIAGGGNAWAGLADDPFYFDLPGFAGFKAAALAQVSTADGLTGPELLTAVGDNICTTDPSPNFFAGFDTTAIVLEVPDAALGGGIIRVWAETAIEEGGVLTQVERMGIPTVNTVFNHTDATKEAYNRAEPAGDAALVGGNISFLVTALTGALDSLGVYGPGFDEGAYGAAIAEALTPDVLTYDTAQPANFAVLNGRALNDDVINVAYSVVTNGVLTSDCVAEDNTLQAGFPYLGMSNNP